VSRCNETAKGRLRLACFGLNRSLSGLHDKEGSTEDEAEVVVPFLTARESLGESCGTAFRTPSGFRHGETQLAC